MFLSIPPYERRTPTRAQPAGESTEEMTEEIDFTRTMADFIHNKCAYGTSLNKKTRVFFKNTWLIVTTKSYDYESKLSFINDFSKLENRVR